MTNAIKVLLQIQSGFLQLESTLYRVCFQHPPMVARIARSVNFFLNVKKKNVGQDSVSGIVHARLF
jgi:hypothetical protein